MGNPEGKLASDHRNTGWAGLGSSFLSVLIVLRNNGGQARVFLRAVLGSQAAGFTSSSFPLIILPQSGLPKSQDGVSTLRLGSEDFS